MPMITKQKNLVTVVKIILEHINIIHHHILEWLDLHRIHKILKSQNNHIKIRVRSCNITYSWGNIYTSNHFVSRIISPIGEVWYHDRIETKRQYIREGHLIDFSEHSLKHQGSKKYVGVVYSV